jgi:hypothetical protein
MEPLQANEWLELLASDHPMSDDEEEAAREMLEEELIQRKFDEEFAHLEVGSAHLEVGSPEDHAKGQKILLDIVMRELGFGVPVRQSAPSR